MSIKVLSIGSDRKIFEPGSLVSVRLKSYGNVVQELHVVVFSKKSLGFKETQIASNVWAYPTNSLSRWLYPFDAARIGKRLIYEKKFVRGQSVITTQDPFECGWAGLQVKKKWRIPLEVQLHTDPFSSFFTGFLNTIRKRIAGIVVPQADGVRVVLASLGESIAAEFNVDKNKIYTLPLYIEGGRIESERVVFDLHDRFGWRFILLSVSRLTKEKNVSLALEALRRVCAVFPDTGMVIAGDGIERPRLEQRAKELGIVRNVAFVGWQEDLASYYYTANAYLQTSRFEGYGLSLIEAGLAGLPVITTRVGIAEELKADEEVLICVPDPGDVAEVIIDLLEHNEKREILAANLKRALATKLISKERYVKVVTDAWQRIAAMVET